MSFLLDTNVLSELATRVPAPNVIGWMSGLHELAVSAVTMEELLFGLTAAPNPRIHRWFDSFVDKYCRVLEVTDPIARHAGVLRGQLAKRGRVRQQGDMLIAATASAHGLTLATRNARDFTGCGVAVVNPFD